ncbi:unnamed protein product [Tuber melanosporum]|jgi:hypothetical protein|uniref:(Perigord truffle) hypothetical protein n=1 Tax=Tuber melanosporum (strain Mel28) TaxID=656061 RepID=D5GMS3_TUBMM|nr:uncharacterized protein GSTUM_00010909001 [Tuber melanosporum]CAZ85816.1 unnamed protein product [Tuber melanosporum]
MLKSTLLLLLPLILAHSTTTTAHQSQTADPPKSWAEQHLEQEHHINNFDPGAFFTLHDFDSSGTWTRAEVLRFYGLSQPDSTFSEDTRSHVWRTILDSMDFNHDGEVSREEFQSFCDGGNTLPDFGLGPGHHGDDEYEYEIHHFEQYHNEDTTEDELTHPEDIEHFRKHDQEREAEERQVALEMKPIVEQNIPRKFLVDGA